MPNIILTEYCNLKCPYCFASKMIEDAKDANCNKNITEEQLLFILNWLRPTAISRDYCIGLIGGEPTLHPQFDKILSIINSFNSLTNSSSVIFTNGLLVDKFIPSIGEQMSLLINVNKLERDKEKQLIKNLDLFHQLQWFKTKKITLGCNLHILDDNYDFFWNIVDRYPEITHVRMSVTAPNDSELKKNKEKYYTSMKARCLSFMQNAKQRNLKITYDCNQIPLCLFSEEEKELVLSLGDRIEKCSPVIDITPDFKATCCFGVYDTPLDCSHFDNIDELTNYFESKMILKTINNNTFMCKDCEKISLMKCQGGCLSFSSGQCI